MKQHDPDDIRYWDNVPLFFRYMNKIKIPTDQQPEKCSYVEIEFYQTSEFETYAHYKPISKVVSTNMDENVGQ